MKMIKVIEQVLFFIIFAQGCRFVSEYFNLPIPGSIIGIIIMFVLLKLKVVKLAWVELGAKVLVAEMMLFFVPSVVGILKYQQLIMANGLHILIVIVVSTVSVMLSCGLMSEWLSKGREEKAQ